MTVNQLLEELARRFNARGIAEPFLEAREIVAALYDVPRFWPLTNGGVEVDAGDARAGDDAAADLRASWRAARLRRGPRELSAPHARSR